MKFWRGFFVAAGLYNVIGGGIAALGVEESFRAQGLEVPNYPFSFQLLLIFVVILGIGFFAVARDPLGHLDLVRVGLASKVAGFGMTVWAILDGQLPVSSWWQPIVNDLVWAIGLAAFLVVAWARRQSSVGVGGSVE